MNSKCPTCGDEMHEPGQSPRSNCGESEISRSSQVHIGSLDDMDRPVKRKAPLYTRKGILRDKPLIREKK